jgi:hypothetical protein
VKRYVKKQAKLRSAGMEQVHPEEDELPNKVIVAKEEYEDALRAKFFEF